MLSKEKLSTNDFSSRPSFASFHTNFRRFSRGNVTERAFELKDKVKLFSEVQGMMEFLAWLDDEERIMHLAYLVNNFEQLNKLNIQMQGKNTIIIRLIPSKLSSEGWKTG
jgi:hypothetical protein